MAGFVTDLWESIFTPGVTPSLLKATYGAFIMLFAVLSILLFFTRNIHVLALLVISFCLLASLLWYVDGRSISIVERRIVLTSHVGFCRNYSCRKKQ